jgi:hypothetical protein
VGGACARDPVATQGRRVLHLDLKANYVWYDVVTGKVRLINLGLAQPIQRNENPNFNVPGRTRVRVQQPTAFHELHRRLRIGVGVP